MANSYTGGSVTAEIILDTTEFNNAVDKIKKDIKELHTAFSSIKGEGSLSTEIEKLKKQVDSLTSKNDKLVKENEKLSKEFNKSGKAAKTAEKELSSFAKTTEKVSKSLKQFKNYSNNADLSLSQLKTATAALTNFANQDTKTSEVLAKNSAKNIKSKKQETDAFKRYTLYEIQLMENLDRGLKYYTVDKNKSLVPLDYYENMGGRKSQYFRNYSSLLRSHKKSRGDKLTGVWEDYLNDPKSDFAKHFQKRMKELLGDMGVTISDVLDDKYKKVRDKSTGKMAEYLDISQLKDNEKWLDKARTQLIELETFKEEMDKYTRSWRKSEYDRRRLKKDMDIRSNIGYEKYGKGGNPFIKDYLNNTSDGKFFKDSYKQAQRDLSNAFYSVKGHIEPASKALDTFNRLLNSTAINWRKLNSMGKDPLYITENLKKAGMALNTFNKDIEKAQIAKKGGFLNTQQLRTAGTALNTFNRGLKTTTINYDRLVNTIQANIKWRNLETAGKGIATMNRALNSTTINLDKWALKFYQAGRASRQWAEYMKNTSHTLNTFKATMTSVMGEVKQMTNIWSSLPKAFKVFSEEGQLISTTTQALKQLNFQSIEHDKTLSKLNGEVTTVYGNYTRRLTELSSLMWKLSTQGAGSWEGRGQFGYSGYINQINDVNRALGKQSTTYKDIHGSQTKFAQGNTQNVSALRRLTGELNSSSHSTDTLRRGMQYVNSDTVRARYSVDSFGKGVRVVGDYTRLTANDIDKMGKNTKNADGNMRKMGGGMTQTAHSGRILSNTLYQIRGALLSLKMIFTAMGGMALWGFAMDIAEGVKQTITAKNEMEAQLRQNSKVSDGGIAYFNQQLEKTAELFPKINKYSIGETVSSIGLEFNMTAKQMAESLDIVSMIQSEYVRAGRKEDEAALAVKDILQGEFQRLSRETGVGKEELIAYGWDEDKTNIEGLMEALRKAALDRHWDVFAKKATSLNDVMTILKSRFSETSADFVQSITPAIVEGFNMLIGAIEGIQKGFASLNPFLQNGLIGGAFLTAITGLGTAIPMVVKGMGLADIATIGWNKSILTAALNLNKETVAAHGLRKALAEVITGTKAIELENIRSTKAIMGRILGVDQATLKEKGYLSSLIASRAALKGSKNEELLAGATSLTRSQKLAVLTRNIDVATAKEYSRSKALLKTATSWKVLGTAIKGVIAIGTIVWLAQLASKLDAVKKRIDKFKEIQETGYDKLDKARKLEDTYQAQMDKYSEGTTEHARAKANYEVVKGEREDLELANNLVGSYKLQNQEREKSINLAEKVFRKNNLIAAGYDEKAATEKASGWSNDIKEAQADIVKSYDEQYKWLDASSKHISENVTNLKNAGASQKQLTDYVYEYSRVAEEAGEHLKQFYQGDMQAGAYYLWDRVRLAWIDISNHPEVAKLMVTLGKTWKSWQPTLKQISKFLSDIGVRLAQLANSFLSTDWGSQTALWAVIGTGLAFVSKKLYNVLGGTKSTIDILKTLGGKLKDIASKWKDVADKAEDANDKMGGKSKDKDKNKGKGKDKDTDVPSTSTGGIKGEKNGSWWESTSQQLGQDATKYVRAAAAIAAGMLLVSEAILMLAVPMWSLSQVGKYFKSVEPSIRDGIDGLKLIAPVMAVFLPPVIALMVIMDKFGSTITFDRMGDSFLKSAIGIAMAVSLVAEAIFLLAEPLIGLGTLGAIYGTFKDNVHQGIEAIKVTNEALYALVPWIPVFVAGIALAAVTIGTEGIGGIAILAAVAGIAIGIGLVTEAIYLLDAPLTAIASIGTEHTDIDGIKRGAEALKITAEALGYVEEGMRSLTLVHWELLADYIAQLIGKTLHIDISSLSGDGGIFKQLEQFATEFAKVNIPPIDTAKAEQLKLVATNIDTVSEALKTVKDAAAKLPDFGQEQSGNFGKGLGDTALQGAEAETTDTSTFFEQIKKPIEDLSKFINEFNQLPITAPQPEKVEAINQASSFITTVKTAVDNLNATLGGAVDAGWNANMASGGIGAAVMGLAFGLGGGTGVYSSSLGTSLNQMYNSIKDIMTFTQQVNALTGGGEGGNASVTAAVNMVTAVDNAIQHLQNSLNTAAPQVKESARAIGTGISSGVKEGMANMSSNVVQQVTTAIGSAKAPAYTYGRGVGYQGKMGFQADFKIKDAVSTELGYALQEMEGKKQEFYDKGYALGKASADGFKAGEDSHSPGIIARTMFAELGYVSDALDGAIATMPNQTYSLAQTMASNFNPSLDIGGISVDELSQFQTGLDTVTSMATNTDLQTSMAFMNMNTNVTTSMNGMTTNVNGAFNGIQQNATLRYNQLVNTTRVSLSSMLSQTTRNITAIKTSWRGMQNALIQSAENIRNETGSKIRQLESNMASFWSKVQNPSTLMASAAGPINGQGTIRRRSRPVSIRSSGNSRKGTTPRRFAAGPFKTGQKQTGISTNFSKGNTSIAMRTRDILAEYLQCLANGGNCAMGSGWNFNWTPDIREALLQWHTHFGEIYDDKLRVGKFENDDFPVRGDADIFKRYVYDAISRTQYQGYFDSKCGDDPIAAYNSGHFNCWDGANIVMRLASAFGFSSHRVWGSWGGIPHVWAYVDGVGDIDATAIQNGYGFTSPKVAGPLKVRNASTGDAGFGNTNNYGDVNVTINVYGDDVEVNENKVDKSTAKQIIDLLGVNPSTGQ